MNDLIQRFSNFRAMCPHIVGHRACKTYITNGYAVAWVDGEYGQPLPEEREFPDRLEIDCPASEITLARLHEWLGPEPECERCLGDGSVPCTECRGSGEHECSCGHEHDCESCDGEGSVVCEYHRYPIRQGTVAGQPYDVSLVRRAVGHAPADGVCTVQVHTGGLAVGLVVFRWNGGGAAVMHLRRQPETPAGELLEVAP